MSFDWSHYLDLALKLYEQAKSSEQRDAHLRSSISRAYYATYHKSRQLLKNKWGISVSKDVGAHGQIVVEFRKKRQYSIAQKLARMRVDRNTADYEDTFVNLEEKVKTNINRAKRVLADLRRL